MLRSLSSFHWSRSEQCKLQSSFHWKLILAVVMLFTFFNSIATAQQAHLVELSSGSGIGTAILPNGRIIVFSWTETKPVPISKVSKAVYVYDKDTNPVPPQVAAALAKINLARVNGGSSVTADEYEIHVTSGTGGVPKQFEKAAAAAKENGLPCLVVMAGEAVYRVINAPKTESEVTNAIK
jgi:hypothetical protein